MQDDQDGKQLLAASAEDQDGKRLLSVTSGDDQDGKRPLTASDQDGKQLLTASADNQDGKHVTASSDSVNDVVDKGGGQRVTLVCAAGQGWPW